MFFPEGQIRVFVYGRPVSMRLSYDGLYALAKHTMQLDPLSGNLFAFINRRANQIKVLYFDRSGWCVWAKRLEQGRLLGSWDTVARAKWTGPDSSCCSKGSSRSGCGAATGMVL